MTQSSDGAISRRSARLILLSVCLGQTIVGLDQRAITVALPTLTTTFHTAFTTIQWTVLVYDLVLISQIASAEGWRAAPEVFMKSFSTTIYVPNALTLLPVLFSAIRGRRPDP